MRSIAESKHAAYPAMPRWSTAGGEPDAGGGTIRGVRSNGQGSGEEEDSSSDDQWGTAKRGGPSLDALFLPGLDAAGDEFDLPRDVRRSRRMASGSGEIGGGGGSTRRRKRQSTVKGKPMIRTSIFFDPRLPNPLVNPEAGLETNTPLPPPPIREQNSTTPLTNVTDVKQGTEVANVLDSAAIESELESDSTILDLPSSVLALSLHAFEGESAFGELSFGGGVELCIEVEDLGGGWSLGFVRERGEEGRGLVPQGWYTVSLHLRFLCGSAELTTLRFGSTSSRPSLDRRPPCPTPPRNYRRASQRKRLPSSRSSSTLSPS